MGDSRCVAFGPVNHFIVGAVMLAGYSNAEAVENRDGQLTTDFERIKTRSFCVPGAACANWGICGAAASVEMAYSIIRETPLSERRGLGGRPAPGGPTAGRDCRCRLPRCCTRDSRIAVREGTKLFNAEFEPHLVVPTDEPVCTTTDDDSVCLESACPYYPRHAA